MLEISGIADRGEMPDRMARRDHVPDSNGTHRHEKHYADGRHRKDEPEIDFHHGSIFLPRIPSQVKP